MQIEYLVIGVVAIGTLSGWAYTFRLWRRMHLTRQSWETSHKRTSQQISRLETQLARVSTELKALKKEETRLNIQVRELTNWLAINTCNCGCQHESNPEKHHRLCEFRLALLFVIATVTEQTSPPPKIKPTLFARGK